jgi:GTP cyclohydrolase II
MSIYSRISLFPAGLNLLSYQRIYNLVMPLVSVSKVADADFPTRWGHFRILGFEGLTQPGEPDRQPVESAIALVMGDIHSRPHDQLHLALARIAEEGAGILLYEQQEGRGIGLMAKLRAYELQDQGLDTIEANLELGFQADCRNFELPAAILKQLGVNEVRLLTNNPEKVAALEASGIKVVERLSAEIPVEPTFERYLETKRDKMGHLVS